MIRSSSDKDPIPPGWRKHLRQGVRARVRASVESDHTEIPVDLILHLTLEEPQGLAIRVEMLEGTRGVDETRERMAGLTPRERAVTKLVASGKETTEIARLLHISPATVRTHVRNAMEKVGAHTRAQLVALVLGRSGTEI